MWESSEGGTAGGVLLAAPPRSDPPMAVRGWHGPLLLAAAVAGVVVITLYCTSLRPSDFLTYRSAAAAAAHGTDLYRGGLLGPMFAGQPFTYTPFAALVLLPLDAFGWHVSFVLWSIVSVAVFAAVMARFVPSGLPRRPLLTAVVVVLTATTCIVRSNIEFGQINLVLLGMCFADLARPERPNSPGGLPRGVLTGLAAAIKLTPALFIVYFLITGQRRTAGHALLSAVGASVLGALIYPGLTMTFLTSAFWQLPSRVGVGHPIGYWANNSIEGTVASVVGRAPASVLALVAVAGAAIALVAASRAYRAGCDIEGWLIVGLAAPLVSPFTWMHHMVFVLPALARLALGPGPLSRWSRCAVGLVVIAVLDFGPVYGENLISSGGWWVLPGVLLRESLVGTSLLAIVLLYRRATKPERHHGERSWAIAPAAVQLRG